MRPLAPLWSRATYRGWIWLIMGGALMMPFMLVGSLVYNWIRPDPGPGVGGVVDPLVYLGVLPLVAAASLLLPDREVERTAARRLLGAEFESPADDRSWNSRWRTGCWFTLHAAVGSLLSGITLALVPYAMYLFVVGVAVDGPMELLPADWSPRWGLLFGPAALTALIALVAAATGLMRRLAPRLLGTSAADRLARASAESARLAARNRIARELHDSVGHALSVVVVQSDAAARLIGADPAFAARAMAAVGETARGALAELDTVIGALREDHDGRRGPQPDLNDLEALAAESGVEADLRITGDLRAMSGLASREAYRIVQEALTNVLRHADEPRAAIVVDVGERFARITVESPSARPGRTRRGGRGLIGMRERAAVLGGTVEHGREGGRWIVRAVVPLEAGDGTTGRAADDSAAAHSVDR